MREDICGAWCANLLVEDHLVLRIWVSQEAAEKSLWFCVLGAGHLTMVPHPRDHGRAPCTTRSNGVASEGMKMMRDTLQRLGDRQRDVGSSMGTVELG